MAAGVRIFITSTRFTTMHDEFVAAFDKHKKDIGMFIDAINIQTSEMEEKCTPVELIVNADTILKEAYKSLNMKNNELISRTNDVITKPKREYFKQLPAANEFVEQLSIANTYLCKISPKLQETFKTYQETFATYRAHEATPPASTPISSDPVLQATPGSQVAPSYIGGQGGGKGQRITLRTQPTQVNTNEDRAGEATPPASTPISSDPVLQATPGSQVAPSCIGGQGGGKGQPITLRTQPTQIYIHEGRLVNVKEWMK